MCYSKYDSFCPKERVVLVPLVKVYSGSPPIHLSRGIKTKKNVE